MSKNKEVSVMMDTDEMFAKAQWMIDMKVVPSNIKKPSEIVTIINKGQQLGMDPLTAINSMHVIQGNVAIKSSVIPGLLAKAGVAVELIKDYEPVMKSTPAYLKGADGKMLPADENGVFNYYKNPDGSIAYKNEQVTFGSAGQHKEYVTTIRFHRYFKEMNKTISSDYSFYWSDAVSAQWHTKD